MNGPDVPPPFGSMKATRGADSKAARTAAAVARSGRGDPGPVAMHETHATDYRLAARVGQSGRNQVRDPCSRREDDVDGFPGFETLDHIGGIGHGQADRDPGFALEPGREIVEHVLVRAGGRDMQFLRGAHGRDRSEEAVGLPEPKTVASLGEFF